MAMNKKNIDEIVRQLLKDSTKTYTRSEIRLLLKNSLTKDQITRVYKRYMYLKNKAVPF